MAANIRSIPSGSNIVTGIVSVDTSGFLYIQSDNDYENVIIILDFASTSATTMNSGIVSCFKIKNGASYLNNVNSISGVSGSVHIYANGTVSKSYDSYYKQIRILVSDGGNYGYFAMYHNYRYFLW